MADCFSPRSSLTPEFISAKWGGGYQSSFFSLTSNLDSLNIRDSNKMDRAEVIEQPKVVIRGTSTIPEIRDSGVCEKGFRKRPIGVLGIYSK